MTIKRLTGIFNVITMSVLFCGFAHNIRLPEENDAENRGIGGRTLPDFLREKQRQSGDGK